MSAERTKFMGKAFYLYSKRKTRKSSICTRLFRRSIAIEKDTRYTAIGPFASTNNIWCVFGSASETFCQLQILLAPSLNSRLGEVGPVDWARSTMHRKWRKKSGSVENLWKRGQKVFFWISREYTIQIWHFFSKFLNCSIHEVLQF